MRTDFICTEATRCICLHGVESWANLLMQPAFYGSLTGHKRPQTLSNDFTFTGVIANPDSGLDCVGHVIGQRDAHLLCGSHGYTL